MTTKDAYRQRLDAQMEAWKSDIDRLDAKAKVAEADARLAYEKQVDDLRSRQRGLSDKLRDFQEANDDSWEELKASLDSAWTEMNDAVKSVFPQSK